MVTPRLQEQLIEAVRQLHRGASQVEVEDGSVEVAEQLRTLAGSAGISIEIQPMAGGGWSIRRLHRAAIE